MCTVSFIRQENQIIITSNRDEQVSRKTAIAPKPYLIRQQEIIFPKDPEGGGTWFAIHPTRCVVVVLLNGAEEAHRSNPPYRRSRGQIVLELITEENSHAAWQTIDLENIEPFTIVLYEQNQLFQLRWNGTHKESKMLNTQQPYIWSSSTLYKKETRGKRQNWFDEFVKKTTDLSSQSILDFHQFTKANDSENGLKINRNNVMKTLSICQVVLVNKNILVSYLDLLNKKMTELEVANG